MLTAIVLAAAVQAAPPEAAPPAPVDYRQEENWLCRPDRGDACAANIDATVISPDGKTKVEVYKRAKAPLVDCFYVYPTVSQDPTPNSDLSAGPEELSVVASQFARFSSVCRPFAPIYRQVTIAALQKNLAGEESEADFKLAYMDVLAAFHDYMKHDNGGRPFVLIGHSQGSLMLKQLVKDVIDGKPLQEQMLSAMLIGSNIEVPKGKDVGGDFASVPLCRSPAQTGCIISFVSFRSDVPPPPVTLFGRVEGEQNQAACTNPADLKDNSDAPLKAYLSARGSGPAAKTPGPWVKGGPEIETRFVRVPGLLTGKCVEKDNASYLEITVHADPEDPRADEITGDILTEGEVDAFWGLHLIDMNLTIGNLTELVREQTLATQTAER